jgi:hypothetical protein
MKHIFTFLIFSAFYIAIGQTGPAGVGNSSTNSFWVDANSQLISNGSLVATFSDVSGNGNHFSQPSSQAQPIFTDNAINGLPALLFDGTSDYMRSGSIPAIESPELTWFVVYEKAPLASQCLIGGNYDSNGKQWLSYANSNNNFVINAHYSTGGISYNRYTDDGSSFNFVSNIITGSNLTTHLNGNLMAVKNASYTAPTGNNHVSLGGHPISTTSYFLDGFVAEAFVYNVALNDLERVLVENYLGAKYGFSIPTDLYSFEGLHNLGVIGIGNDGSDSHTDSQGSGALILSNPTDLNSGEYLLTGHTDFDLTVYNTTNLPSGILGDTRWERTWRADETGEVGNVNIVFDLSGTNGFADVSTYELLIDDDGDFSNATIISGTYNAGNQTANFIVNLAAGDYLTLSGLYLAPNAIHSITSGDWTSPATWDCGCVPTSTDTVYIENTDNVLINADVFVHNLIVESSATVKMNLNFQLSILGDFTANGTVNVPAGTIGFVGTNVQNVTLNSNTVTFNNIIIENIGGSNVNLTNGTYVLNNTLYPNNGVLNIDVTASFIINSSSANTSGRVDVMSPSFSMIGNIEVRRFLPAGVSDNRNLSSPLIGAALSHWDTDISISGLGFPDGCAASSEGCYFSVKQYEDGAYIDITSIDEVLNSGEGYEVYLGTDINTFDGATITSSGTLRPATDFVVSVAKNGWSIQGNPYASPILFSTLQKQANIADYFYVYDAATGGYQWYDGSSNTSSIPELANGMLAIGQGYWAFNSNTNTSYTMTYKQSDKTSSTATFIRDSKVDESIYLTMKEDGTTYSCIVNIDFNESAYDNYDTLDIMHLSTGLEKASSLMLNSNGGMLRKQFLNNDSRDKVLDMSVNILNEGYFTIECSNIENLNRYSNVTLIDNFTGDVINLKKMNSYTFYAYKGQLQRFQLILSNRTVETSPSSVFESGVDQQGLIITQIGNSINVESEEALNGIAEINIFNLLGQEIIYSESFEIQAGSNMMFLPSELSGIYLIVVKSINGIQTKKIIL